MSDLPLDKPRSVTPGIETQSLIERFEHPGVFALVDWLRFTCPEDCRLEIVAFIESKFGELTRATMGAMHFKNGVEWPPGIQLSGGHSSGICMLDIRGERFSELGSEDAVLLMRDLTALGLPLKITRIDLALDYILQDLKLCDNALESCQQKELCTLRRFGWDYEQKANGFRTRKLVKLGKRDSAVCARIYDKGLQQMVPIPGIWERIEVEFKKDRAAQVFREIVEAGDGWPAVLQDLVLGAFDFREDNGRSEQERRPRAEWWAQVIGAATPRKVPPDPFPHSAWAWWQGLVTSYGRTLKDLSVQMEIPLHQLIDELLHGVGCSCSRPELATGLEKLGIGRGSLPVDFSEDQCKY